MSTMGGGGVEEWDLPLRDLREVEEIIGYRFEDMGLLETAFTDSSSAGSSQSYERLEYVGDSVLNLLITREQFDAYPDLPPGTLTRLRAANVDTEKLARVAVKLGLHPYLRHRKPLLAKQIQEFRQAIIDYPLHSNGLVDAPKVLADIVESTIGAVFIDSNASVDTVWKVFKDLLEPIIIPETLKLHPRSQLYEMCQKKGLQVRFVDLWKEHTTFEVFVDGQFVGKGSYGLKKEIAQNRAAKVALDNMEKLAFEKDLEPMNEKDEGMVDVESDQRMEDQHQSNSKVDNMEMLNEKDGNGEPCSRIDVEKQIEQPMI